jgi:hypothetical protein
MKIQCINCKDKKSLKVESEFDLSHIVNSEVIPLKELIASSEEEECIRVFKDSTGIYSI